MAAPGRSISDVSVGMLNLVGQGSGVTWGRSMAALCSISDKFTSFHLKVITRISGLASPKNMVRMESNY